MTDYEAIITARDIQMRDNPSWIEIRKLVQKHESKIEELEKENAELKSLNKEITDDCHKLVNALENWQNENVELLGKVAFLENDLNNAKAQIEKMKCCESCNNTWEGMKLDIGTSIKNLSEWEKKELAKEKYSLKKK